MSLDVMLTGEPETVECVCPNCFDKHTKKDVPCFYSANITHNLSGMADVAGIYKELWRPEEIGITKASQLRDPLYAGLARLKGEPKKYKQYDAPNGWGLYEHFVLFVENYLHACIANPDANVEVSR